MTHTHVYVLFVKESTDVAGEVMEGADVIGVYTTYEKADAAMREIGETYTRKFDDYDIIKEEIV